MTIKTVLIDSGSGKQLSILDGITGDKTLITETHSAIKGVFKAVTRTTAGTTTITAPRIGGSIHITDLIMTTDKTALSDVTVRFTDGSDTVNVIVADSTNNTVNIAIAFTGLWRGWKDARLEVVTVADVTATVAVGYVLHDDGIPFTEWDDLRG